MKEEETVLIYDVCSVPEGPNLSMTTIMEIWRDHKIVLWDSNLGHEPTFEPPTDKFIIIDMAKQKK